MFCFSRSSCSACWRVIFAVVEEICNIVFSIFSILIFWFNEREIELKVDARDNSCVFVEV